MTTKQAVDKDLIGYIDTKQYRAELRYGKGWSIVKWFVPAHPSMVKMMQPAIEEELNENFALKNYGAAGTKWMRALHDAGEHYQGKVIVLWQVPPLEPEYKY